MSKTIPTRTLWPHPDNSGAIQVIDQRRLPHEIIIMDLVTTEEVIRAIKEMIVRGAPLIGATAAYGVYFACREAMQQEDAAIYLDRQLAELLHARPTAVNLAWAIARQKKTIGTTSSFREKSDLALLTAGQIVEEDVSICHRIGEFGLPLIRELSRRNGGRPVNILTHCNAGRLGCIEWGTATSPIYQAWKESIAVHVWVDETRPRNQGASLTAWELGQAGIPHTVIVDNAGGHLLQQGLVDMVIVGADRVTTAGDVANKIGTYLKALAAWDNSIPFYVAIPFSTIDWNLQYGWQIPIEIRSPDEVKYIHGWDGDRWQRLLLTPPDSPALNYGFDVTPARLVTSFITEKGIFLPAQVGPLFRESMIS